MERSKRRARQLFYWPGMSADVENSVSSWEICQKFQASQPKESMIRNIRSFDQVSTDLFSYGNNEYLVYVDRFSGWPIVDRFNATPASAQVIASLKRIFRDTGIQVVLASDGGRQFTSAEFKDFVSQWHVTPRISSLEYPQSNGHAEAGVKAMKALVKKHTVDGHLKMDDFNKSVLEWHNVPRSKDGFSPFQLLFGRPMRTRLPIHHSAFAAKFQASALEADVLACQAMEDQEFYFNRGTRDLSPLTIGTEVHIQSQQGPKLWDRIGTIVDTLPDRNYEIRLPSGWSLLRNRRYLRPVIQPKDKSDDPTEENETTQKGVTFGSDTVVIMPNLPKFPKDSKIPPMRRSPRNLDRGQGKKHSKWMIDYICKD